MHAVRHQHQNANALRRRLLARQIARGLLVLGAAAERRNPAARLEVEAGAGAHQIVGGSAIAQAQVLAFLEHAERRRGVADHIVIEALQLLVGQPLVQHTALAIVAGGLGKHRAGDGVQQQQPNHDQGRSVVPRPTERVAHFHCGMGEGFVCPDSCVLCPIRIGALCVEGYSDCERGCRYRTRLAITISTTVFFSFCLRDNKTTGEKISVMCFWYCFACHATSFAPHTQYSGAHAECPPTISAVHELNMSNDYNCVAAI